MNAHKEDTKKDECSYTVPTFYVDGLYTNGVLLCESNRLE